MPPPPPEFNPHLKWLGIRSTSPDHYQLLGIERFESDPDVISAAADRQMAHVRKYQNGPHSNESQQLLNQLASAKLFLLSSPAKSAYDEQLAQLPLSIGSTKKRSTFATATVVVLLVIAAAVFIPSLIRMRNAAEPELANTTPLENPEPNAGETELIPVGISPRPNDQQQDADGTDDPQDAPADTDAQPAAEQQVRPPLVTVIDVPDPEPSPSVTINRDQAPWDLPQPDRRTPVRPFAGQKTSKAKLLQALFDRKQPEADKFIKKVMAEADSHLAQLEAIRLEVLYWKFTEFWQKVAIGLERSSVGSTLEFRAQPVTIEAKSPQTISLRAANGQTKEFSLKVASMDPDLAIALARANGQATGPMLDVMIAVFLATDRQGDLAQAKPLLEEAQAFGIPVEVLLANNEEPADEEPGMLRPRETSSEEPQETSQPSTPPARQEAKPTKRPSPPGESVRRKKLQMIRDVYRDQYAARGNEAEMALAKRLFNDANRTSDDPDSRYTMYEESIRLASEQGDVNTAGSAIRAMAYNFDVDEHEVRMATFKPMRRNVRGDDDKALFCKTLVDEIEPLIDDDDYQTALQYTALASSAARSFRKTELIDQIISLKSRLEHLQDRFNALAPQRRLLTENPDSNDAATAQAHLEIGSFLAFEKGDFEKGCQHLVMGGDHELADVAERELDDPKTPPAQLALADLWWELGESNSDFQAARSRAVQWYQIALPSLEGISRKRAATRIESSMGLRTREQE